MATEIIPVNSFPFKLIEIATHREQQTSQAPEPPI